MFPRKGKSKDGTEFETYSIVIDKAYKKDDEWKHTKDFDPADLRDVAKVAGAARDWLTEQKKGTKVTFAEREEDRAAGKGTPEVGV